MHGMGGIHSALAIKRQRRRRDDQRRAKERRYSVQSSDSCDTHGSTRRKHHNNENAQPGILDSKVASIGMLHIGVVFIVFGLFLVGAGVIPDDITEQAAWSLFDKATWWNELVITGFFAIGLGIFLVILNSIISKKEDEDLEDYVQRQLTRSRSGHRLERDCETGVLTTRNHRKTKEFQKGCDERGLDMITPTSSEVPTPTTPSAGGLCNSGDMLLEKILEEDGSYADDYIRNQTLQSPINDKRLLLGNGHSGHNGHSGSVHVTNI